MQDVDSILFVVNTAAQEGSILPLAYSQVVEHIRDFFVWEEFGKVVGCARLKIFTIDIAEIRSVAVLPAYRGKAIGSALVKACIEEARGIGLKRVFVLTKSTSFFGKLGFREVSKRELPHKVWQDCIECPKFYDCDEVAMVLDL